MLFKVFFRLFIFIFCAAFVNANAASTPQLTAASQQLAVEQARNALLASRLKALQLEIQKFKTSQSIQTDVQFDVAQRAVLAVALTRADLDSINLTLTAAQQGLNLTENNIRALETAWQNAIPAATGADQQAQLQAKLKEQRELLVIQQARVKVLQQTQQLTQQTLFTAQDWQSQLQANYQAQQQRQRQAALNKLAESLQREQQKWLTRVAQLDRQLHAKPGDHVINNTEYARLSMGVFEAEERSNLSQIELDLAKLHNGLDDLSFTPGQALSLAVLNTLQHQVDVLHQQLKNTRDLLQNKILLLQQRIQITKQALKNGTVSNASAEADLMVLRSLLTSYQAQFTKAYELIEIAHDYRDAIAQQLKQQLASRQTLPGFNGQAWIVLSKKFLEVPVLTWQAVEAMRQPLELAGANANAWTWGVLLIALAIWLTAWNKSRRYLNVAIERFQKRSRDFWAAKTILISMKLLQRNLSGLMLLIGLMICLFFLGIPIKVFSLALGLAFVTLGFSVGIGLARLLLLEGTNDVCGHDVRLYYRLKWALVTGGLVTILTILVHQLPVAYEVQDLFGRLFMVFLLAVAFVLFKSREVVPRLLEPYFVEGKRSYVRQVVRWLSWLVPASLFINAAIGLIGYVELAWTIASYQGLFLIVFSGYLLARGLLDEVIRFSAELLIRYLRNGWLWREALLKPLHRILKIALFLSAILVLFNLYGWDKHSVVVTTLFDTFSYHLVTIASTQITLFVLIEIAIIVAVLAWAARWTREFSYRWLFARTKDLGLRNSLAIFTQYTLVVIGIISALDVLGLNLTALTFIASAFAVGVGFGLRDLANNFASGMLLLIERPVKVGDWVTVGTFEGQVLHIGARSITVLTNDHQELLVPNADVFSKLFINWTRRDSIVRSVVMLKVSRQDDPAQVRQIILDVIKTIPNIVANPPAEVYFKELEGMLLEFKIDYYVDIHAGDIRSTVRSQFLFALWERFKKEGIRPPEYPQEVIIQEQKNHD